MSPTIPPDALDLTLWGVDSVLLGDLYPGDLGIHDPRQPITIVSRGDAASARHAVVMPVHNQAARIEGVLRSLHRSLELPYELCIVVDDCTDATLPAVLRWMRTALDGKLTRVTLVLPEQPIFETLSDVVGIRLTSAPYIIEVQADMSISDLGFDRRLLAWFDLEDSLLAVSGRGGHDWDRRPRALRAVKQLTARLRGRIPGSYSPTAVEYYASAEIGRTGSRISRPASLRHADRLFLHETVMRGPLALRRRSYDQVGGLDPARFFLGDDDHDLCTRARSAGLTVGYTPVRFDSPLEAGSTRADRTAEQKATFSRFSAYYRASGAARPRLERSPRTRRIVRKPVSAAMN